MESSPSYHSLGQLGLVLQQQVLMQQVLQWQVLLQQVLQQLV